MKKPIIGTILIIIGSIICILALIGLDFDFQKFNSAQPYKDKIVEYDFIPTSIIINDQNCNVIFKPSLNEKFSISYNYNEDDNYTISDSTETDYKMDFYTNLSWYQKMFLYIADTKTTTVYIPTTYIGNINIKNSNGSIKFEELPNLKLVIINSTDCKISITNTNFTDLTLKANDQKILIKNVNLNNLTINSREDDVTLSNINGDKVIINNNNGETNATNVICDSFEVYNIDEDIKVKQIVADKIILETTDESIKFEDINSSNIKIKNKYGNISGSIIGLMGDYKITSSAEESNNLPTSKTDGDKELDVRSPRGSINIIFK